MNDLAIMSLIEQRDSLNERVNNLEEENQQLIETNAGIFIEIEELKSLIKEATPHVKKSLDSIFEIDLRFSHMIKNKEACEKWLVKAEKIK